MRLSFRLIGLLIASVTLVAVGFTLIQIRRDVRELAREYDARADSLADHLAESLALEAGKPLSPSAQRTLRRYTGRYPYIGLGVFAPDGSRLLLSDTLQDREETLNTLARQVGADQQTRSRQETWAGDRVHLRLIPLKQEDVLGRLLLVVQKASPIDARVRTHWKTGFLRLLIQAFLISFVTLIILQLNVIKPLTRAAEWMRRLRLGEGGLPDESLPKDLFGPLAREATHLAKSLTEARAAAEAEARLRQSAESVWTTERLKEHVRSRLQDRAIVVVSNREPYMHVRKGKEIQAIMPASGLVTALEPILRACGGTWVAHGAGDADRDTVDARDRVMVPPEDPLYTLRRVWLSADEENGYYYGFSNEGLWPLCHIAHTRPLFRAEDWAQYQSANEKFSRVVLQEIEGLAEPLVLIQDYHFALLPRLIKEARPDARVALFWHIPWPNPESFGICPWQRQILNGMLGADLLGFHVQFHCNNFLDTVDRALESRIDWERFAVNRQNHTTWVKPFPISVGLEPNGAAAAFDRACFLREAGIHSERVGVGVDRIDYTKGIVERFRGIERYFEKFPDRLGRFTFVELGAPSRTLIPRYHDLMAEVESETERINTRFKTRDWKPIVFMKKHHSHADIEPWYRAADVCLVTSLHDGMNLVAKEYVAARSDELGSLILSRFTGASRDLRDALIVNPYDIEQLADALHQALTMPVDEQRTRMRAMRESVRERNIYWWAASLLSALAEIRTPAVPVALAP